MHYTKSAFFCIVLLSILTFPRLYSQDAVINKKNTQISLEDKKLITTKTVEIQINNRKGDRFTEISIAFSKLNKISKLIAYITDKDGKIINKLKSSDIKERSLMQDFSFFEDNYVKEFTLVHNVYPYTIYYQYQSEQTEFLFLHDWFPISDSEVLTKEAILTLNIPADYKINFTQQFIDSFRLDTLKTGFQYFWKVSNKQKPESEAFSPSPDNYLPNVQIVPVKFRYEKEGSFESWKTFGNWEYRLMEGLDVLSDKEKLRIDELISGVTDKVAKIKILYHYLQDETRYINISVGKGGMKPFPAGYVSTNKYGDCKALTNYFKAILNYIGIESIYTDVNATDASDETIYQINRNFPSQQFNHVILCVPLSPDTLWLDCTSKGPFNHLGTFTQNHDVFLVDKNNSHFSCTPKLTKNQVHCNRNITVEINLVGAVQVDVKKKLKAERFENLSSLSRSVNENMKEILSRNMLIDNGFEMLDYKIIPAHRDSDFIEFQYHAKADNLLKKYGNEQIFKIIAFYIPEFKDPTKRKLAVQVDFPIYKTDTIRYSFPATYTITGIPQNKIIKSNYGEYSFVVLQNHNELTVVKSFYLLPAKYKVEQYKEFYNFIKKVTDSEYSNFITTQQ